ncbi:MAG: lactate permease LctP family transporter [Gemmataceae bacterium]|nr:lactate permease LctP family transporter [Gemmataceae bacterium]
MTTWTQLYDPLGSPFWSTALAALPIVLLLGLLATGRVSAHVAALVGLAAAFAIAVLAYVPEMSGVSAYWERVGRWLPTMLGAAGNGAAFGLMPIGWIVVSAIFLYTLTVETGQFEIVKHSVVALSPDRRIQALLIAFSFGAFIEGAAGFGTPVAISAALLMGAGFRPLQAAGLALLANTSPVAFGALGTPIITLARVTLPSGMAPEQWELMLSQMAGRQLPFFSLLVPAWLVWVMAGWRGVVGVWPALVVCGGSFAAVQYLVANYVGPHLVDVAGGLISLVSLTLFLRVWQPRAVWHFPEESPSHEPPVHSRRAIASAWMPWVLLTGFVFVWGLGPVKAALNRPTVSFEVPALHNVIVRDRPVVPAPRREEAEYHFNWLSATGTSIFLAAVVSAWWLSVGPARFLRLFAVTLSRVRWALFTIACMLAIAFTTRYSGMDATLGLAFTHTGWAYPIFAALLGWLGVALTGSDTSSNALFGSLQTITASRLATDGILPLGELQAKVLLAAANSTGGVMGKMIDAQSIVVAAVATGQHGQEGPILRFVFWHSLILAILMGLLVLFQAYVWTGIIP